VFIEAKDDGGGGDNWTTGATNHAKLQSSHHHQQTIQYLLQAGCPSCHPTNSVKALKGKTEPEFAECKLVAFTTEPRLLPVNSNQRPRSSISMLK